MHGVYRRRNRRIERDGIWTSFGFVPWRDIRNTIIVTLLGMGAIHMFCLLVAHWRFGW